MQFAFPFILLAITVIGVLGASVRNIILVVGLSNWCAYARVCARRDAGHPREGVRRRRAGASASRSGRSCGATCCRTSARRSSWSPSFGVAGAILTEAGLSFLGLGVPLAIPSWGGMTRRGPAVHRHARTGSRSSPGAALFVTVMGINLLGDALRDALDPYLQTRHTRSSVDRL